MRDDPGTGHCSKSQKCWQASQGDLRSLDKLHRWGCSGVLSCLVLMQIPVNTGVKPSGMYQQCPRYS